MKKEQISQTNPYLRDRAKRQVALVASVCSSSAIEGIESAHGVIDNYLQKTGKKIIRRKLPVTG